MDPFLTRLLISVFVYFFFNMVIEKLVKKEEAKAIFEIILIGACVLFLFVGSFLPAFPIR